MAIDRIREALERAKKYGRIGLIPYVTVGFPTESSTTDIVRAIVKSGADKAGAEAIAYTVGTALGLQYLAKQAA